MWDDLYIQSNPLNSNGLYTNALNTWKIANSPLTNSLYDKLGNYTLATGITSQDANWFNAYNNNLADSTWSNPMKSYKMSATSPAQNTDMGKVLNIPQTVENKPTFDGTGVVKTDAFQQNPGANGESGGLLDLLKGDNLKGLGTLGSIGFGLWNAYMGYQNYKENKKSAEQMRRFNEENQARQRHEWARQDANRASISAAWNR